MDSITHRREMMDKASFHEERVAVMSLAPAYQCYLVLSNPAGTKNNLGNLIRCAAAFAVAQVVVVGADRWSTHGAHGSHKHMSYQCFDDWKSAAAFLALEKNCDLCGIVPPPQHPLAASIPSPDIPSNPACVKPATPTTPTVSTPGEEGPPCDLNCHRPEAAVAPEAGTKDMKEAFSRERDGESAFSCSSRSSSSEKGCCRVSTAVHRRPFRRSTAFVVGHRNRLENEALGVCDYLVHVEQAIDTPMELDAPVTASIGLHHFTAWARYHERRYTGEKFDVESNLPRYCPPKDGKANEEKSALAQERARLREERLAADPLGNDDTGSGNTQDIAGFGWLSEQLRDREESADGDY